MLGTVPACRPTEPPKRPVKPTSGVKPADILIFPHDLRVPDPSVNAFVERAMRICGAGNYDEFRLLWSARAEPLPRDEFEQGWQAVEQIRIRALEPAIVAGDPTEEEAATPEQKVYLALADVSFDPNHPAGRREPQREVVLMLIREQGKWRLTRAPRMMRDWIREQVADEPADGSASPAT